MFVLLPSYATYIPQAALAQQVQQQVNTNTHPYYSNSPVRQNTGWMDEMTNQILKNPVAKEQQSLFSKLEPSLDLSGRYSLPRNSPELDESLVYKTYEGVDSNVKDFARGVNTLLSPTGIELKIKKLQNVSVIFWKKEASSKGARLSRPETYFRATKLTLGADSGVSGSLNAGLRGEMPF